MKLSSLLRTLSVAFFALSALGLSARADAPSADLPEVNHYVYLSFLPEPAELMKDAAANGLTILRLDKTADKVVVSYKYPDGHTATLGYALLSAASSTDRVAGARMELTSRPTTTTVVTSSPEVVYVDSGYRYRYYEPVDDFWLPLTLGIGLGWATGWHGGYHGYHGGWHGGGHWHR